MSVRCLRTWSNSTASWPARSLRDGLLAAGIGPALAKLDQAEEDPAGDLGPERARERRDDRFGVLGDRHIEAGAVALCIGDRVGRPREDQRLVRAQRQHAAFKLLPEQDEGLLYQRQHPRRAGGIGGQALDQCRLDVDADRLGRLVDRLPQAGLVQRGNLVAVALNRRPDRRGHQFVVEVGADGQDDMGVGHLGQAYQRLLEGRGVTLGDREQLLELIDHRQQASGVGLGGQGVGRGGGGIGRVGVEGLAQLGERLVGRPYHDDAPAAGAEEPGGAEPGDEAGDDQ